MRLIYVQTISLDTDLCKTSRLEMMRALTRLGYRVSLLGTYDRVRPISGPDIELICVPSSSLPYVRQLLFNVLVHARLFWLLLTRRYQMVVLDPYTVHCAFPFDVLSRLGVLRLTIVMDLRSGIFHARHRMLANVLLQFLRRWAIWYARVMFRGFTTISPMMRDTLVHRFHVPVERIGIWQSGVALERFDGATGDALGLFPEKLVVMYHGTFGTNRGLLETVEAMRLLQERCPDVVLLLLGNGTEEPKLRAAAAGLKNVIFHDAVPHEAVAGFLHRCDVGIMPFLPTPVMRSSSPLKLMECLAAAKPVIVSRIEAFTQVIGDDPVAIYLEDQTPVAIADAIVYAARHRADLPRWGAGGRKIVESRYTWDRQAENLHGFLQALA